MSYMSKLPASWNNKPLSRKEIDSSSPGLALFELERFLFTGKVIISYADEVYDSMRITFIGIEAHNSCDFRQ